MLLVFIRSPLQPISDEDDDDVFTLNQSATRMMKMTFSHPINEEDDDDAYDSKFTSVTIVIKLCTLTMKEVEMK